MAFKLSKLFHLPPYFFLTLTLSLTLLRPFSLFRKFPKLICEEHDFMDGVKVEFYEKYLVPV